MLRVQTLLALVAAIPGAAAAQSPVMAGVTAGAVKLTETRSEQALTGVVQYQPNRWLILAALPSYLHVTDSVSSSGPGDLPVSAAAFHAFAAPAAPVVAAAVTVVLPVGDASCGLGSGETALGLDVGIGVSPAGRLHLSADASRSVSGVSAQSVLSAPHATSLRAAASYDVAPRWKASASLGADVGEADSAQGLSRLASAGVSHAIAGPLALTLDGTVGLTTASPKWALSLGLGTAFAGAAPPSLSSPLARLRSTFVGGVSRGVGAGKPACR